MFDKTFIGSAINRNFKDNVSALFEILNFSEMELQKSINISQAALDEFLGINSSDFAVSFIGNGTLVFGLQAFADNKLLENLSKNMEVVNFYINSAENVKEFSVYKNGICVRDTYSDDQYDEIGIPFDIEENEPDRSKVIINLLSQFLKVDFLKEFSQCEAHIYRVKRSLLRKMFDL